MRIKYKIETEIEIKELKDLKKLRKYHEVNGLEKPNFSQLKREMGYDTRTLKKYYYGEEIKKRGRKKGSNIDKYEKIIRGLLSSDSLQKFYYKAHLFRYLQREYGLDCKQNTFNKYILNHREFNEYFKKNKKSKSIKTETPFGKQAQFDWKEKMKFYFSNGESIYIYVGSLVLSASRMKIWKIYLSSNQNNLFDFLTTSFETIGGIPKEILIDNAKTMMDVARTKKNKGKINSKFQQYADDFGFKIKPCMSFRPQTKAKVEVQMKIIDELMGYNGKLDNITQLYEKLEKITNESNMRISQATGISPIVLFQKEKEHLLPLPHNKICSSYKNINYTTKVNTNGLFKYKSNLYSVPAELTGKTIEINKHDDHIHIYYNKKLVTIHKITKNKINYNPTDHLNMFKQTFKNTHNVDEYAKKHLKELEVFNEQLSEIS